MSLNLIRTSREFDQANGLGSIAGPTRYFLYRLINDPEACEVSLTVRGYVERFRLNDRVVGRALKELEERKVLVKMLVEGPGGRRRVRLLLSPQFVENLEASDSSEPSIHFSHLAHHVLTANGHEVGKPSSRWLTPFNRMVLAVLLVRADAAGAVYEVGTSDLKRLAGLTDDGLRSQLSKLMDLGYLRSRVAGVTGKFLLGRSKSAYFINTGHPDFRELGGHVCVLIRQPKAFDEGMKFRTAFGMYTQASAIRQMEEGRPMGPGYQGNSATSAKAFEMAFKLGNGNTPLRLHDYFQDAPQERFYRYLQMLINRYASQIVNSCLHEGRWDGGAAEGGLLGEIRRNLDPGSRESVGFSAVVDAIAYVSVQEAVKVWEVLISDPEITEVALSGVRCSIMPLLEPQYAYLCTPIILCGNKIPDSAKGACWKVEMGPDPSRGTIWRQMSKSSLELEKGLDDEQDAMRFGLRSVGKKYPANNA